jgi:hypothetical protein
VSGWPAELLEFPIDRRVDPIRRRLRIFSRGPLATMPGAWGFAVYRRVQPVLGMRFVTVLGVVTGVEAVSLTSGMIAALPERLWLERARTPVELIPVCAEAELLHEPASAVRLRLLATRPGEADSFLISAHDLPVLGLVFMSDQTSPPPGWPQ